MFKNQFSNFRLISYIEGISYIILVFIAMPLKYLEENLVLMRIMGMGHGLLFMLFCIFLFSYSKTHNINKETVLNYFIYSLSPFGFLLIENSLKKSVMNGIKKV